MVVHLAGCPPDTPSRHQKTYSSHVGIFSVIELNRIYTFRIDTLFHEECPKGVVKSMSQKISEDGRASSPIITSFVHEVWFPELQYVDEKYVDFRGDGFNIEKKMFTRHGAKFCPSYMVGSGRTIKPEISLQICKENNLIYLLADANEFPNVYITFVNGVELHELHKTCSIGYNNKWRNFYFGCNVVS